MSYFSFNSTIPAEILKRCMLQTLWNRQACLARRSALAAAMRAGKRSYRQELADALRAAIDVIDVEFGPGGAR
jgi:hypothetical protein